MPVPKRRQSRTRRDKRRANDGLSVPAWSTCSNCGETCRPHHVCAKCGFYKGKKIVELKQAK
jgi:large subunit ribosomal protein L32